MISLLLATSNPGKIKELQGLLGSAFQLRGADSLTVVEDGSTYQENALKKAKAYFAVHQSPLLVDDSGLEIDALAGKPGVHTAVFGGESLSWPERWAYLLGQLNSVPESKRTARFRCVLCYYDGKAPFFFEGVTEGRVLMAVTGTQGFGYDPLFYSLELNRSFAESSVEEKARVSHRGRAASAFLAWSTKNLA